MKINDKITLLFILAIAMIACNALAPKPTATPVSTATSLPTSTLEPTIPPVPTENPVGTEKPTEMDVAPTETDSGPALPTPAGTPAKEWNGIPIMPGAIAGADEGNVYSFTTQSSVDEIQKFYDKELKKLGWSAFAIGEGQTQTALLMFMKDSETLTLTFLPQGDGTIYVMLVK
jgi:hypothetical protein